MRRLPDPHPSGSQQSRWVHTDYCKRGANPTSRFIGVSWDKRLSKWHVSVVRMIKGSKQRLEQWCEDEEEAAVAVNKWFEQQGLQPPNLPQGSHPDAPEEAPQAPSARGAASGLHLDASPSRWHPPPPSRHAAPETPGQAASCPEPSAATACARPAAKCRPQQGSGTLASTQTADTPQAGQLPTQPDRVQPDLQMKLPGLPAAGSRAEPESLEAEQRCGTSSRAQTGPVLGSLFPTTVVLDDALRPGRVLQMKVCLDSKRALAGLPLYWPVSIQVSNSKSILDAMHWA